MTHIKEVTPLKPAAKNARKPTSVEAMLEKFGDDDVVDESLLDMAMEMSMGGRQEIGKPTAGAAQPSKRPSISSSSGTGGTQFLPKELRHIKKMLGIQLQDGVEDSDSVSSDDSAGGVSWCSDEEMDVDEFKEAVQKARQKRKVMQAVSSLAKCSKAPRTKPLVVSSTSTSAPSSSTSPSSSVVPVPPVPESAPKPKAKPTPKARPTVPEELPDQFVKQGWEYIRYQHVGNAELARRSYFVVKDNAVNAHCGGHLEQKCHCNRSHNVNGPSSKMFHGRVAGLQALWLSLASSKSHQEHNCPLFKAKLGSKEFHPQRLALRLEMLTAGIYAPVFAAELQIPGQGPEHEPEVVR